MIAVLSPLEAATVGPDHQAPGAFAVVRSDRARSIYHVGGDATSHTHTTAPAGSF